VGYADVYGKFIEYPAVVEASDVILAHYYPYWEGISITDTNKFLLLQTANPSLLERQVGQVMEIRLATQYHRQKMPLFIS